MAQPKRHRLTDSTRSGINGDLLETQQEEGSAHFVAALLEKPEIIIADLHEEIDRLASALIDSRLKLESGTGSTRQDVALDLYDEELITKRDVMEVGGIDRGDFFDLLIKRRQARMRVKQG